jgi:hypothetical protein
LQLQPVREVVVVHGRCAEPARADLDLHRCARLGALRGAVQRDGLARHEQRLALDRDAGDARLAQQAHLLALGVGGGALRREHGGAAVGRARGHARVIDLHALRGVGVVAHEPPFHAHLLLAPGVEAAHEKPSIA